MKSLAAFLFLATFTATSAFAMGNTPAASSSGSANEPASFGDQYTSIRRSTPKPDATPKGKVPITAMLSKDSAGKQTGTTFASSDSAVFCIWKAETGAKGEKVRVAWFSEGGKGKKITDSTQTIPGAVSISGSGHIDQPAGGFPAGKYHAEVYDDGKLVKSLPFTITK